MSFDDDEYETDPGPQAEYEAYANTLCRGCHHLRRFHRDAGLDNPDHPTMPCWDRDVDQNDEERTVECMCLGWWEPGEPCPYETEEYLSSAAPRWADMTEEERQRAWEVGQSVQGKGAYQLDKEAVEELYAQASKVDDEPHHIVKIDEDGWTIKHPLLERVDDKLFDCEVGKALAMFERLPALGTFEVRVGDDGSWTWRKLEDR